VLENFSRSARLLAEHEKILSEIAEADFQCVKTDNLRRIHLNKLLDLSDERQRLVLRLWLLKNQIRSPSEKQLKQIQRDVLHARNDAHPVFVLNEACIKRQKIEDRGQLSAVLCLLIPYTHSTSRCELIADFSIQLK